MLEEELDRARKEIHRLSDEIEELKRFNGSLTGEIQRRDQAISEAVDLICYLESIIDQLQEAGEDAPFPSSPPLITHHSREDREQQQQFTIDVPERTSSKQATSPRSTRRSAKLKKIPSFLRDDSNQATLTLRGLYRDDSNGKFTSSAAAEENFNQTDDDEPASPRLSVLSECSELTPKEELETPTSIEHHSSNSFAWRSRSNARVERWIRSAGTDMEANKTPTSHRSTTRKSSLQSSPNTIIAVSPSQQAAIAIKIARQQQRPRRISAHGDSRLPPTPDTMSPAVVSRSNSSAAVGSKTNDGHHHYRCQSCSASRPPLSSTETSMIGDKHIHDDHVPITPPRPSTSASLQHSIARPGSAAEIDVPPRPSTASTVTSFDHHHRHHRHRSESLFSLNNMTDGHRPSTSPHPKGLNGRAKTPTALDTADWLEAGKMGPNLSSSTFVTPDHHHMQHNAKIKRSSVAAATAPYSDPPSYMNSRHQQQRPPGRFSLVGSSRNIMRVGPAPAPLKKRSDSVNAGAESTTSDQGSGIKRRWLLPLLRRSSHREPREGNTSSADDASSEGGAPAPVVSRYLY